MKIIDAHVHFRQGDTYFSRIAVEAGHKNSEDGLRQAFSESGVEHAIAMDSISGEPDNLRYPDFISYCAGIGEAALNSEKLAQSVELAERHLRSDRCVGVKIYAGYTRRDLTDPVYMPFYELARQYDKPVAVHTGTTAFPNALLKYSHPMQLDEIAVAFPDVTFVMCHFGNPWLIDAAAVVEKNHNVMADLSGWLVGRINAERYLREQSGYVQQLKTWIAYVENYDKFLFGTDWPLVNIGDYVQIIKHIIPAEHHEKVFYDNARRVYHLK